MSKNLTRKGLAFGALVALSSSLFAGTAANAAEELTLAPKTGTSYGSIEGETFTLSAGLAPSTPAGNTVQLKYQVVTTATAVVKVNSLDAAAAANTPTAGQTTKVTTGQATNTTVYKEYATPTVGAAQSINLTVSSVTALTPATAVVTAFFDANANDILDAGEFSSAARTITWYDAADVTTTITPAALTVGDTTASATMKFNNINNSQITLAHVGINFTRKDGTTALAGLATTNITTAPFGQAAILSAAAGSATEKLTYSSTTDSFSAKTVAFTAVNLTAGSLANVDLAVQGLYLVTGAGVSTPAVTDKIGTAATLDAVARTVNSIDATASGATGVKEGAAVQAVPGTAGSLAVDASNVKDNTVTVVATVKDSATTPAVVANAAFKVTVTPSVALSSTNSFSINGTAYTANLTAALDATTDSKGQITLVVKNATAVTAGTLALAIAGQNITNTVTITYAAPTYTVTDLADSATSNGRTIVKASAYKLDYKVVDQFGDAPSKSSTAAFRLVDTVTGTTATANGGTYYSAIAADGTASFSFTDNSTVAGSGAHVITIQSSTDGFANQTAVAGTVTTTVVIKATALEATAKTITLGNPVPGAGQAATTFAANVQTGKANLSEADFVASFDARYAKTAAPTLGKGYTAVPTHSSGSWTAGTAGTAGAAKITIPVTVKDSTVSATALDGATVTVTGKGLFFKAGNAYGSDSLTFLADSGSTSVDVYSHVTGEQSIVFTSGTATSTQKITFTNFGTEVASVTLGTLAAQAQAGQSLSLSATAKDKWGNLVDNVAVVFSNTGAGYIQDISAQLTVAGVANGRLIALGADLGTSTVTATAAKAKTLLTADLTSAKSIELGVTDADVTVGGRAVYASVEFAKGKTVTVTVDGRRLYSKLFSTDAYTELKFTQKKAGKHTVTIRVSGGIVYSETVVTTK